jgi:hypothetical protein
MIRWLKPIVFHGVLGVLRKIPQFQMEYTLVTGPHRPDVPGIRVHSPE